MISPLNILSISYHLALVVCSCSWCRSNWSVRPHFSKLYNFTKYAGDDTNITSQREAPRLLEINWLGKDISFLTEVHGEDVGVFTSSVVFSSVVFQPSALAWQHVCVRHLEHTFHDHSWETTVITLTICWTVRSYDQDDVPQNVIDKTLLTHKAFHGY